jgi:hypothetical protein
MGKRDRADVAEWILRRVVDSARASEFVGDQLETRPGGSNLRFWLSIAWLVVVFSWRTVVGIVAASIAGVLFSWIPFSFAFIHYNALELRPSGLPPSLGYYLAICMLLWNAVVFFMIRFGFRSDLTKMGLASALLGTYAVCTFWMPKAGVSILVGAIALLLFFVRTSSNRRTLAVLLSALASGGFAMYMFGMLGNGNPLHLPRNWLLTIALLQLLLVTIVECVAASFLHQKLVAKRLINGTTQ